MKIFLLHLLLTLAWLALTGSFSGINFLTGFTLAFIVILFTQRSRTSSGYVIRLRRVAAFAAFFLWELVKANLRVAWDVLTPRHHMRPGVIAVPLALQNDLEILVLTTCITLTPGTLSLDVSTDRQTLYIHAMYIDDEEAFRASIKEGYEKRVMEVFG